MVSARARLKYVEPLVMIGIAMAISLTVFVASLNQWQAYPWGFVLIFAVIMFCGVSFALGPIVFATGTEKFLLGSGRTHWKLDQRVSVVRGDLWFYPFHLPKNGWLGVRCNSDSPVSVEIVSEAYFASATATLSRKPEESRRNVRKVSLFYRAGRDGNWVIVIRNISPATANVEVKVSEWVTMWS